MTERNWKVFGFVVLAGACFGLLDFRFAAGFLLGAIGAVLMYKRIEAYCDSVIQANYASSKTAFFGFMINYAIMAGVLVLSALYRNVFNIFFAAAGLMSIKIAVVAESFLFSGKEA
ncbi:MAG: hypothetical protein IKG15_08030 [Solobacterium sp.]|nr:hypothetical protein [Solobacterium sp.]